MSHKCDSCGTEQTAPSFWALAITLNTDVTYADPMAAKKAMHPYKTDRTYYICYPCFLRSLGVNP